MIWTECMGLTRLFPTDVIRVTLTMNFSAPIMRVNSSTTLSSDLNNRLCYASCENGTGLQAIITLAEILNMPCVYSKDTWGVHVDKLMQAYEAVVTGNVIKARKELHKEEGSLPVKSPLQL